MRKHCQFCEDAVSASDARRLGHLPLKQCSFPLSLSRVQDVLTCSCLQLCELRGIDPGDMVCSYILPVAQSALCDRFVADRRRPPVIANPTLARPSSCPLPSQSGKAATNKLAGTGPAAAAPVPASAEGIEFWHGAEHVGWLTKKGEHLSTWRKRWFVLKGGHLFWFYNTPVTASSKARGIIPLKTCTAVRSASVSEAGKPYALELEVRRTAPPRSFTGHPPSLSP